MAVAVAVAAFFFVGLPLTLVAISLLRTAFTNYLMTFIASVVISLVIFGGVIGLVGKLMYRPRKSWNRFRMDRLERMLAQPGARDRFPHRFVEFHHNGITPKSAAMKKHIAQLQPGATIVVDCPRHEAQWRIQRSPLAFEPIPWEMGEDRLAWLFSEMPDPQEDAVLSKRDSAESGRERRRRWYFLAFRIILVGGCLLFLLTELVSKPMSGWSSLRGFGVHVALVIAILGFGAFKALVVGSRYFLVPGGLVRLDNGLLYRTPRVNLYTRRDASLVIYAEEGGFVAMQGKVRFVNGDAIMMQCLLIAWLSEARTPTMQELRTLLAPEASAETQPAMPGDVGGAA